MRPIDLVTLKLFVTVCETRNLVRAGERENIAGSAISKRLAQLEERIGTPLLARRRHGVVPTPAGEAMLEHARAVLAGVDRMEHDMSAFTTGVRGQVRILATASAAAERLADDLAEFLGDPAHADILVDIEERVSTRLVRGIREGVASLGICWDAADMDGLQSRKYRSDNMGVVVHPSHALAACASVSLARILDFPHVGLQSSSAVQSRVARAAAVLGKRLDQRLTVSTFDAALKIVRAKLAICLMPCEVAAEYAQAHGLCVIPLAEPWAHRRFAISYRDEAMLSTAARLLMEFLASKADAGASPS
jgi:DNA-binding transcriptional LysR family regulator